MTPAASLSPEAILMLQRTHGNRFVRQLTGGQLSLSPSSSLVQRMQTTVAVEEQEDESDDETGAQRTPPQPQSPHDKKVAADLEKINAPDEEDDDLDPTLAAQALAGLGLEEPEPRDEVADMEETLRLATEFGVDEKIMQGYKKEFIALKVKRILDNKDASTEDMSSLLQEGEGAGLPKAVLDPLRLPILTVNLQRRCGDLRGQVLPLQAQAQQFLNTISPLKSRVDESYSIIMLHPKPEQEGVIGCRKEGAGLQQQLNAAHGDFEEVVTEFTDILEAVTGDLPPTLPALKKRESVIESQKDAFTEQKANFETAKATHKKALAADGAVSAFEKKVTPCFDHLCAYYLEQVPYLSAYNAKYDDEWLPYYNQVMHLDGLNAQPLKLGTAKQIVKAIKDLDFTVSVDDYLKKFKAGYDEYLSVPVVMGRMLTYKKSLFRTYPTKGKIGIQHLLTLNLIGLRHKGSYRDKTEKAEKKGAQHGPFSRSFWVRTLSPSEECNWVVHVHYHSDDPTVRNTKGNIDKMHAKTKEDEFKKGGALADWTHIGDLQDLVTATLIDLDRDQKGGLG